MWGLLDSMIAPAPVNVLRDQAAAALGAEVVGVIEVGSDEHAKVLDRVARARCAEWLDTEHGMDQGFARELVDKILDLYIDSTRVRR